MASGRCNQPQKHSRFGRILQPTLLRTGSLVISGTNKHHRGPTAGRGLGHREFVSLAARGRDTSSRRKLPALGFVAGVLVFRAWLSIVRGVLAGVVAIGTAGPGGMPGSLLIGIGIILLALLGAVFIGPGQPSSVPPSGSRPSHNPHHPP